MALQVKGLEREFRFKQNGQEINLPDPDPGRSPEQVLQFYTYQYPELTTAKITNTEYEGNKIVYEVSTTFGVKG
jgi:PRTRC genetic system protein C